MFMAPSSAVSQLVKLYALENNQQGIKVYNRIFTLLNARNNDEQKTKNEIEAFIKYRCMHNPSTIGTAHAANATRLLDYIAKIKSQDISDDSVLITSQKALKKDASKFFIYLTSLLAGHITSLDEIELRLNPGRKFIKGQAEQPVGILGATECAMRRVREMINPEDRLAVTIESFLEEFDESKLGVNNHVQDRAVIGLGVKLKGQQNLVNSDTICLLSPTISLPATYMQKAIKAANKAGLDKTTDGYAITAGSQFEKTFPGSQGADWQAIVSIKLNPQTLEVKSLSRRGQLIRTVIDALAELSYEQIEPLDIDVTQVSSNIVNALSEMNIDPAELYFYKDEGLSLGLLGKLTINEENKLEMLNDNNFKCSSNSK